MNCEQLNQVHAYHDGELPTEQRAALESHLSSCPECSELLTELRGLSRMLSAAALADVPADVMQRLRDARYVMPENGVLKIAGWLTAAAAAVLLAALLYFPRESNESMAAAPEDLDRIVVMPPTETSDNNRSDLVALA